MEGEERRDRLARLQLERLNRPPRRGWKAWSRRTVDGWMHFTAGSGWEKAFFAAAVVLIAALAIGALFVIISNAAGGEGGKRRVTAGSVRASPTATFPQASATPTTIVINVPQFPTAQPQATPPPPLAEVPSSPDPDGGAPPREPPPTEPPPTEPPPPAPTESGPLVNAGNAAAFAVYWIEHDAPQAYTADASSCTVLDTGGFFVVTCSATLAGCQSSVCQTIISVCVLPDPLEVRPADQC